MALLINLKPTEKNSLGNTYKDIDCSAIDDAPTNKDLESIKHRIRNLFDWTPGSRILLPGYGNILERIKYQPLNDLTLKNAEAQIRTMFGYEPIVKLTSVDLTPNYDQNELKIRVDYAVPSLDLTTSTSLTVQVAEQ